MAYYQTFLLRVLSIFLSFVTLHVRTVGSNFRSIQAWENLDLRNFYPDKSVSNVSVYDVLSRPQCCDLCIRTDECKTFFYHGIQSNCHIFEKDFTIADVIPTSGWSYFLVSKENIQSGCPPGSDYIYRSEFNICYKIYSTPVYTAANTILNNCRNEGTELLKVTSQVVQDYVTVELGKIPETFTYALIQGNDDAVETVWTFDDGTPLTYFNWNSNPAQPNDVASQNIIVMSRSHGFKWHDIDASFQYYYIYICEINV